MLSAILICTQEVRSAKNSQDIAALQVGGWVGVL
jgi:hypothetical protein